MQFKDASVLSICQPDVLRRHFLIVWQSIILQSFNRQRLVLGGSHEGLEFVVVASYNHALL